MSAAATPAIDKAGLTQDLSPAFMFMTIGIAAAVILAFFSKEQGKVN
jgi:hypothetical protein